MAAIESSMLPLGTVAPAFELPDPHGALHRLSAPGEAPASVVMFLCNHCPYVKLVADEIGRVARDYGTVRFFGINSNDVERYPADGPEAMIQESTRRGYTFPYVLDASQDVARAYGAGCTPEFFVFDGDLKLVYRGQMDESRPSNGRAPTGRDLRNALDAVLAGQPVPGLQRPAMGCSIKWKPGSGQGYFD